jgi:two-component system, LytTR family, sensor kinase
MDLWNSADFVRPSLKRPGWLVLSSHLQMAPDRAFWMLQCSGWSIFAIVTFWVFSLHAVLAQAAVQTLAAVLSGVLTSTLCRATLRAGRPKVHNALLFSVGVLLLAVAGGMVWGALNAALLYVFSPSMLLSLQRSSSFPEGLAGYAVCVASLGVWQLLYLAIKSWIALELARDRITRAETAAQTARLRALQSQLQPHFIFNSLNAISTLVGAGHSSEARAALALLGDFLRRTLIMRNTPEITVAEELEFVRLYFEIIELRFGDRLRSRIYVDPRVLSSLIPSLLLQPLVENAVRHGLLPRDCIGTVDLRIESVDSSVLVTVEDDGVGLKRKAGFSVGLGLSNTATRLSDLYGSEATLSVQQREPTGVCVQVRLPRRTSQPFVPAADA